jgi:UDP-N-acetylmuramoyl-L-alanyl-D-glutamate--2,6-diaminopimelate ligase
VPAWRTTPEAADLAGFFSAMTLRGTKACVMEVSSHALALQRVHGLEFDAAVFTNLTRDHLDYHVTMEAYMAAKAALFDQVKPGGVAAVNLDDEHGEKLARDLRSRRPEIRVLGFGRHADSAVQPEAVALDLQGIRGALKTPVGRLEFSSPLLGEPNLQNLLAAVAATAGAGVEGDAISRGIARLQGVSGRFERIEAGQPFSVVVDYAHTDDALKCCLATLRALGAKRLITVFGCGGNRDKGKRPLMGAVATRLSDLIILTSDNPRDEDPAQIARDVEPGIRAELRGAKRHEVILERAAAIQRALELAKSGDVVAICGKGHESTQTVAGVEHPFSDQAVARAGLEKLRARDGLFVGH